MSNRNVKNSDIKDLLKEEIDYKKSFEANYDIDCNLCWNSIFEGDQFVFMGNKKKICNVCMEQIQILIEEL